MLTTTPDAARVPLRIGARAGRCIHLIGASGTGKTQTVYALAAAMREHMRETAAAGGVAAPDVRLWPILMACQGAEDLGGYPVPDTAAGIMRFLPWGELPGPDDFGILFFDELDRAGREIQNAQTRVVHERRTGALQIGENVAIVAASNGTTDVHTTELSEAMRQRMTHLYIAVDQAGWLSYGDRAGRHASVQAFGRDHWDAVQGAGATFEDLAGNYKSYARAWDVASDLCTASDELTARGAISEAEAAAALPVLLQGTVGFTNALKYIAHRACSADLPALADVELDPMSARIPPTRPACYSVAAMLARPDAGGRVRHGENRTRYLARLPDDIAEFGFRALGAGWPEVYATSAYCNFQARG